MKVRLRFTIEREIDLAGLQNNFLFHTKNEERNEGLWDGARRGRGGEGEETEWDERAFPARQFRSRGEIDRDDVQIILF